MRANKVLGLWLILASVLGWTAAFVLTLEKFEKLLHPSASASCDFSVLVQCSTNLDSWQGSVFGFPNPLIGIAAWVFTLVVGVLILAEIELPKWFWWLFLGGVSAGLMFVIWLIGQSIYSLGTLCPWCMVTWAVMIPTAIFTWCYTLGDIRLLGNRIAMRVKRLYPWVPLLTIIAYSIVATLAQLRLDVLSYL